MIFENNEKDWKDFLSEDSKQELSRIFDTTKNHRCAYMHAEDVKIAQLWCALVEMRKELNALTTLVKRVEEPFRAIVSIGEAEKRNAIERVVTEIMKPTEKEEREATQKLVDSLMKF